VPACLLSEVLPPFTFGSGAGTVPARPALLCLGKNLDCGRCCARTSLDVELHLEALHNPTNWRGLPHYALTRVQREGAQA